MEDKYPKLKELNDFLAEMQIKLKKLSEELNKQPREYWIIIDGKEINIYHSYVGARYLGEGKEVIHVREIYE